MLLLFAILGSSLLRASFQNAFEHEIELGYTDQRLFHMAFESILLSFPDGQQTPERLPGIAQKIQDRMPDVRFTLFTSGGKPLSEDGEAVSQALLETLQNGGKKIAYRIDKTGGRHTLTYMTALQTNGSNYYLESTRDIERIYGDRKLLYQEYLLLMGTMALLGCALLYFVSKHLTKNISLLGRTTRQFSRGNYDVRSGIRSDDEVGLLARDFNRMADSLEDNIYELRASVERQEDFTAAFSHELKTPMTSIVGYADMLRSMKLSEEETVEYADYIYTQGRRLENLSHNMLRLLRIDSEPVRFQSLSVPGLAWEAAALMAPALEPDGICCTVTVEEGQITGNRDFLLTLLLNLLDNARKASARGQAVALCGTALGDGYVLSVRDSGCGIPAGELSRVTEAFYMVDKSRSRRQGGAGLGLAMADRIVKLHGASMRIESSPGAGTTVALTFPADRTGGENSEE